MNPSKVNRLYLLLTLMLLGSTVCAQTPSKAEVEALLNSDRKVMAVGQRPADFGRDLKEWYTMSRNEGWRYGDPRLLRKNNEAMQEAYLLLALMTSGELSYGDVLSRWGEGVVEQMTGDTTVRCYYMRTDDEVAVRAFSQGVLIFAPSLLERSETEAHRLIKEALEGAGIAAQDAATGAECYAALQRLNRKSCGEWRIEPAEDIVATEQQATVVLNDTTPLVVVNPCYEVRRGNGELKMKKTAQRQLRLDKDIQVAAEAAGCRLEDYSAATLMRRDDEQFYNEYSLLSHWARSVRPQEWIQDSVERLMERLGAHQYLLAQVDNQEGVMPTMLWSAAAIGVVYTPALVALTTHLFSHSETFTYHSLIGEYDGAMPVDFSERYTLHDEHGYLRSSQYDALCKRMGRNSDNLGYLGRHFDVAIGPSLGVPGLASLLGSGITHGYAKRGLELCPSMSMEYATGHNWSVAADLDVNWTELFVRSDDATRPWHETWNPGLVNTLGITGRYYRHECEAPLGGYLGGGLALSEVVFLPQRGGYDLTHELVRNKLRNFCSLRLVWGRNYFFSRHLFLNYALTFDFPVVSAIKPLLTDNEESMFYREDVLFTSTLASDVWYQNTFTISVKLGLLP